jgi:hypothetical protein
VLHDTACVVQDNDWLAPVTAEADCAVSNRVVSRRRVKTVSTLIWGALTFSLCLLAVFGFVKGYPTWGRHSPGFAAILGVIALLNTYDGWRRGIYIEAAGVKIVRPWRPHAIRVDWQDIARFEMQTTGGWPVILVRGSDQRRIPVPTFPRPSKSLDSPDRRNLRDKVEMYVNELNLLLEQHSRAHRSATASPVS